MAPKQQLIADLLDARRLILELVLDLPPEKQDRVFLGAWSVRDLLAHLAGWDFTNVNAVQDIRAGRSPGVFKQYDPDWATYNAELVRRYRREDFVEMLDSVRQSHQALIEFVQNIPDDEIDRDFGVRSPGGMAITVERFLRFEIDDEREHARQIRDWLV
jgi:hypothetical protein